MIRALFTALAISSASASISAPPAVGVPIRVATTAQYDTDTSSPGDAFLFETIAPATVGNTVVPAGTQGEGVVVSVVAGQGFRGGSISFVPQYLDLAGGRKISVRAQTKNGHFDERVRAHFFPGVMTTTQNLTVKTGVQFEIVTADTPPEIAPSIQRRNK